MREYSTTCPCPACDDRRSTHIERETFTLQPHKPMLRISGRSRRNIVSACQYAHTGAEMAGRDRYLYPTMYGWALSTEPSAFTSYIRITPTGDCTEYVYDPCGVQS